MAVPFSQERCAMRKTMWFSIGLTLACFLGVYVSRGILLPLAVASGIGFAGLCRRKAKPVKLLAAVSLGVCLGSLWFAGFHAHRLQPLYALDGQVKKVTIRVTGYSWETDYGSAVDGLLTCEGRTDRVRFYTNEVCDLTPGDMVFTSAELVCTDDGRSEEPSFHRSRGIFLLAYQALPMEVRQGSPHWTDFPVVLRQMAMEQVERWVPGEAAAFAKALVLGDGSDLSDQRRMDFSLTGISHVVAVSGLHVSILMELVLVLTSRRRIGTVALGIPVLLVFVVMTGGSPSMVRAATMEILALVALLTDREYDPPTALAVSALGMLLWNPLTVSSVSFQLSFGAVVGIVLFQGKLHRWITQEVLGKEKLPKPLRQIVSVLCATVSATALTAPLGGLYFGVVSLISPLCNFLILPVVPLIFSGVLGLLACVGPLEGVGLWLGRLLELAIQYVYGVSQWLAGWPLAAVFPGSVYVAVWLMLVYGLLTAVLGTGGKGGKLAVGLSALALTLSLGVSYAEPLLYGCTVTALDVGQGQCILLRSGSYTFLVDCGGDDDAAADAVYTLRSQGIFRLDGLILTHFDRDHVSGVPLLARYIQIDGVYMPDVQDPDGLLPELLEATEGSNQTFVTQDTALQGDGMVLTLYPSQNPISSNDSGLAVLFQTANCDTLVTGDWNQQTELAFLADHALPELEVLVVGHHGSKHSTSEGLLSALNPKMALISVGADNPYGHPAAEVLQRLEEHNVTVFRTDQNGQITFRRWGNGS